MTEQNSNWQQTFEVIVEARKNSARKGVAKISPGFIQVEVDKKAIFVGNFYSYIADVFKGSPGKIEIDLQNVRPVRCLGTRMIYFIPDEGTPISLAPVGITNQKQVMAEFVKAIEEASGKTVLTEDLKNLKLIIGIFSGIAVIAMIIAIIIRLVK